MFERTQLATKLGPQDFVNFLVGHHVAHAGQMRLGLVVHMDGGDV